MRGSLSSQAYFVRNPTLAPQLQKNHETPPTSRDEGLLFLHGLESNPACSGIFELRRGIQVSSCVVPGKSILPFEVRGTAGDCSRVTSGQMRPHLCLCLGPNVPLQRPPEDPRAGSSLHLDTSPPIPPASPRGSPLDPRSTATHPLRPLLTILLKTATLLILRQANGFLFYIKQNLSPLFWPVVHCCSVPKLCLTLCDPMDCSTSGFSVLHYKGNLP